MALELLPQIFHFPSPAVKSDVSKSLFNSFSGMSLISQVICNLMSNGPQAEGSANGNPVRGLKVKVLS